MANLSDVVDPELLEDLIVKSMDSSAVAQIVGVDIQRVIDTVSNVSIAKPTFRNHNSGDAEAKVVDNTSVTRYIREATHNYHIEEFDDLQYRTNPALIRAFLRQVVAASPAGVDRYFFSGKSSGTATNWVGLNLADKKDLVDADSVRTAVYALRSTGWKNNLGIVFDYSVYNLVAEIFAETVGTAGNTNISVTDGSTLFGVPVYFRDLGTEVSEGKQVVGAVISGDAFRVAVSPLELIENGPWDSKPYRNKYELIADQVIAVAGDQSGAVVFEVTIGS